jgi:hypothetical protein
MTSSANIIKLNQALTGDADIRRISLVGCNIDLDNLIEAFVNNLLKM